MKENVKPSSSRLSIKRSPKVRSGYYNKDTHYYVDTNTLDVVMRAAIEWSREGDVEQLMSELSRCKQNLEVA